MAKVTFNPNQPIQSLSGSMGKITFRTINGKTFVHERCAPELPKNPTRQQRARFKQRTIIDSCLTILQSQIDDIQEAISMRSTIKDRLVYLYKKFEPAIKARTKLQKAIMAEYYARFSATSSVHERTYNGTSTVLKRTKPSNKASNDIQINC